MFAMDKSYVHLHRAALDDTVVRHSFCSTGPEQITPVGA